MEINRTYQGVYHWINMSLLMLKSKDISQKKIVKLVMLFAKRNGQI